MTKFDLKKLKDLNKEIEILQKQMRNITVQPKTVTDCVKGSLACFPYSEQTIRITGVDVEGYERKVVRIRRAMAKKLQEVMQQVEEINRYIESVEDCEIRNILRLRYVDCLTWEEIEEVLHMNKRTAQRKFRKWWDKN